MPLVYDSCAKDAWWSTTIVVEYERERGQRDKDGRPTGYAICSTKSISAPLERVYAAFGEASTLDRWLGPRTKLDFVDGGALENADGDRGSFKKIRANKDIKLAWERADLAPGSSVEVLFADKGKGMTGITLNHSRLQTRREADLAREAWGAALNALKSLLENA
ncbi:MAG: SRPBCC domain-containing protein [Planctomycetes bacterium]|nr:SRPBCC domain-containing protein [Planctomycetota bacterium]